jgi:hypothetical protein
VGFFDLMAHLFGGEVSEPQRMRVAVVGNVMTSANQLLENIDICRFLKIFPAYKEGGSDSKSFQKLSKTRKTLLVHQAPCMYRYSKSVALADCPHVIDVDMNEKLFHRRESLPSWCKTV